MKKNVLTHQRLKNRAFVNKGLAIFSLSFLFSMLLCLAPMEMKATNRHDVTTHQNDLSSDDLRARIDSVAFICQGEMFGNAAYTLPGTYSGWFITNNNDTVFYDLTVYPSYFVQTTASICEGESYSFYGQTLTESGFYTHTMPTVNGCDSTIELHLTVNFAPNPHIFGIPNNYEMACGGELAPICWSEEEQTNYQWAVVGGEIVAPISPITNQPMTDSTWILIRWNEEENPNASISVNYVNSNGCTAPQPTVYHVSVTMPIEQDLPIIHDTICEGEVYLKNGFYLYDLEPGILDTTIAIPVPITPETPCGGEMFKTLQLVVVSNPSIEIIPSDTAIYAQQVIDLCVVDHSAADTLDNIYVWTYPNGCDTAECITVAPMQNTIYTVRAINSMGCWDYSATATVRVLTYFDNPENLEVVTVDCHPVLTWDAPDFPYGFGMHLGYVIYRDGVKIAQLMNDELIFIDDRMDYGTYTYCVTALYTYPYNTVQVESDAVCFEYESEKPEYFNPPLNAYAYPSYDCSIVVIWDAPESTCWGDLVGYNIFRSREGVFEKQWLNLPANKLVFIDTDVHIKGMQYTYCVQAVYENFDGLSDPTVACSTTDIDCGLAINVYPNPADDYITAVANDMDYIKVYDIVGKYITTIHIPREYCHEYTFSTAAWSFGTYVLKIYFIDDVLPAESRRVNIIH